MSASTDGAVVEDFKDVAARLGRLPVAARKLLCVIVNQAYHGALRYKEAGVATMPEVHEACGLDVDGMYAALRVLREAGSIELTGQYPFEEIRLTHHDERAIFKRCEAAKIALQDVIVELRFDLLKT